MKLLFHTAVLLFINVLTSYGQKGTDENAHYEVFRPSKGTEQVVGDVVGFKGSSYFSCQTKGGNATYFEFGNNYKQVKKNEFLEPKSKIGVNPTA